MSKPPPHSGRGKKPELSPTPEQTPRQKTAKQPRLWNSGISPAEKGKSAVSPSKQPSKEPSEELSKQTLRQPQQQLPKQPPKQTPRQAQRQTPTQKQTKQTPKELPKQMSKQPPKQPTKTNSWRSSTSRNTGESPHVSSVRDVHKWSPFHKRGYETASILGSPSKKLPSPVPKDSKVGSLPGSNHSPAKDDEYFSSLLKRSRLSIDAPSKAPNAFEIPSQNDKGPRFDQICDNKSPVSGVRPSGTKARCLFPPGFIAERDEEQDIPSRFANETIICERMQPSRRTGKLRSPVGTPVDESQESWLPADNTGGDWQAWRPPQSLRTTPEPIRDPAILSRQLRQRLLNFTSDSVDELRDVPMRAMFVPGGAAPPDQRIEAAYLNPEAHILAIDPNITLHTPRLRRSATVSDPVHPTAATHGESLNSQARQYFIGNFRAQIIQNDDHAFQMMPKSGSQHYDYLEPQNSKGVCQPTDRESAYQAMLRKAHYKPDQTHQPRRLRGGGHRKSERGEKDAPFSRIVIQKDALEGDPKIVLEPTPTTVGRYLQPSSRNIIRAIGSIVNGVSGKPQKAEPNKDDITRKSRRQGEPSPIYKPIREPISPNKHNFPGRAENSYTPDGWFVDQEIQQNQDNKSGPPQPNSPSKSALDPTENGHHSVPPAILPAVDHSPSNTSPRRTLNKSVSWDPAITLIGPVINPVNERPTTEAMFERLFVEDGGKGAAERQETGGDKDVDAFVSTFKRWKKGDRNKLDSLLKALRDIETDTDTDSENGEKVDEDIQNSAQGQDTTTGFDPRVPDFKPIIFRENEIWLQKVSSHTCPTLSASARPTAPATINIPFHAALQGRPPWPITGKFGNTLPYQRPLRAHTRPNSRGDSQPTKKRVIWDNPEDPGGREAVMQSQRWAGELLERFTKKYPLTGQKAAVVPKKRLEDLPISRSNSNTLKVAKMVSDAADIQQKLEVLLMQKKEAKARGIR
ncbi:hypothetical protein VC83_00065 [Pseudogymnoascus destructans]|uniref:Uncharacterized protein n=2 Tax=Pseudogymnoascus destructans TaxID=655981 RepID=L8G7F8_PSED2|nr:uncharacterized protein VC83_00065 [Pseudogymnoascus destructans]ELR07951.1 hypothetical protein GMDG_02810 [Pseudogymnoascus destructans 20631-21]OAF63307.1 hypothetical protein VC83_00065 [Pseudogymnoascus destructans]WQG15611.1 hypothetical protein VC83_00065 [Pseudogymnoascus destructans]